MLWVFKTYIIIMKEKNCRNGYALVATSNCLSLSHDNVFYVTLSDTFSLDTHSTCMRAKIEHDNN